MLDLQQLSALAADLESDRVERKESLSGSAKEKVGQAICAFANDLPGSGQPGVVFIGLRDDGTPTGAEVSDTLLKDLGGIRSDGLLLPLPVISVQKIEILDREVAVVVVQPSNDPPVRYRGTVWIRVGPRRATASRDDERRLAEKRRAGDLSFDLRPISGTSVADLDMERFTREFLPASVSPDVLQENRRPLEQQLEGLHLTTRGVPNATAILMLGKDVRFWLPGAYVQFVRFEGTDMASPVRDEKELVGPIPDLIRQLDELLRLSIPVAVDFSSASRELRRPEYPLVALQQLVRNALVHRSYEATSAPVRVSIFSDRIEIESPGGLYGRVTPENFGRANDYRNPTLAASLKALGYVQRFGAGIPVVQRTLQENGNPPAEFAFDSSAVLATVRRHDS